MNKINFQLPSEAIEEVVICTNGENKIVFYAISSKAVRNRPATMKRENQKKPRGCFYG